MLIQCPECELQVSDKAIACPHCGYPLKSQEPKRQNINRKRKRLPNGFGQITEIKDKALRKPFRAMITVGRKPNGRPICKLLQPESYFSTYNEAYSALMEYNKNPYELDSSITIAELYEKWTEEYFKNITDSSQRTIKAAWVYVDDKVKNINVKSIRPGHIKNVMQSSEASVNTKNRIKSMFNLMLDYAVEYGIADKNYARDFNIEETPESKAHISYTDEELDILWQHTDLDVVNIILLQCYSGWRPAEMFDLTFDWKNINMTGGSKTDAGKNRTVPIHSKVIDLAKKEEALLKSLTYDAYFKKYKAVIKSLGLNPDHKPHDGRKTFVTLAKKYKVDEYAIKKLVGHAISDITEKTYTDRDESWFREEIEKIK